MLHRCYCFWVVWGLLCPGGLWAGDGDDKLRSAQQAAQAEPASVTAACQLADTYLQRFQESNPKERKWALLAVKTALDARTLDPSSALPHVMMAQGFEALGDSSKALDRTLQAVLLDPANPTARTLLERLDHRADGDQALTYDFEDPEMKGWNMDGSGCWAVAGGVLVMQGRKEDGGRHCHLDREFCNLVVEVDLRKPEGDGGGKVFGYGLYLRSGGRQRDYYEFIMVHDGRYQIGKGLAGEFRKLVLWPHGEGLRSGHGEWNRIRVVAVGDLLRFYGNDRLLHVMRDNSHGCGKIALFAIDAASSDPPDRVEFDNLVVRSLDSF